jgi:hypothetical protein
MDVLATRVLSYPDENGDERELVLSVFMPFEFEPEQWRCGYIFSPPIHRKGVDLAGVDFIQAFLCCLVVARGDLEGTDLGGRVHWQGMLDCGLPWPAERATSLDPAEIPPPEGNAGEMEVLTTRAVGYPDESGAEAALLLTVFVPFEAENKTWKCGFAFGPPLNAPLRHGVGADFIEALVDCLAMARATFEGKVPTGWVRSGELYDLCDLPYKIGRSFWTD